jgi:tRNA nucleotidyltransferase (CCA-adding enzyme)
VHQASIQLDLQRRDFTINTLAISLAPGEFGKLLDYYRGWHDIKEGLIQVLHSLSIIEDPTRAFRAVRFESRLGFRISRMTTTLIANALDNGFMKNLSQRRLVSEIKLVCQEEEPSRALERLETLGLLKCVHPKLKITRNHSALFKKVDGVRDWYKLTFSDRTTPMWLVYFLALTSGMDTSELIGLVDNLEEFRRIATALVQERPTLERISASGRKNSQGDQILPSEVDELFGNISWPGILYVMALSAGTPLVRAGAAFLTTYRRVRSELNGDDLVAMGCERGPLLQKILNKLRKARLDGKVKNVSEEKALVLSLFVEDAGRESYQKTHGGPNF